MQKDCRDDLICEELQKGDYLIIYNTCKQKVRYARKSDGYNLKRTPRWSMADFRLLPVVNAAERASQKE